MSASRNALGFSPSRHSLPGPEDITRVELPNGIVMLVRRNDNSPSVVINGYLEAGSLFEPDDRLGLADFVASALMRGTQRRNFQQIYDTLESVGASLGFNGGVHTTGFGGRCLAEDLPLLFDLLAETLTQPAFPEEQVERLRVQILTELAIRAQDTAEMASLLFDQILYPGHPYSRPEDGYPETVQAITLQDLREFHRRHYGPRGMLLVVVGAVEAGQAVDLAARSLGEWRNPQQPAPIALPPAPILTSLRQERVTVNGKSQADVLLGAVGPERMAPDYTAAAIGNSILGQFGMMGRIGEAVREKAGLAYYAFSSLNAGVGPGPWQIAAGVAPGNVERAIELIRQEVRRFVESPVEEEELADVKANFIGSLPLSLESNGGVAGALVRLERYKLGLDYYQRYEDLVNAVTREDVLRAAQRYLHPERLGIAIAGP